MILELNAELRRKPISIFPSRCSVTAVFNLPYCEYSDILKNPLDERKLFAENLELMGGREDGVINCILITCDMAEDGILVNAEGYDYARYCAFVPEGKILAQLYENQELNDGDMVADPVLDIGEDSQQEQIL